VEVLLVRRGRFHVSAAGVVRRAVSRTPRSRLRRNRAPSTACGMPRSGHPSPFAWRGVRRGRCYTLAPASTDSSRCTSFAAPFGFSIAGWTDWQRGLRCRPPAPSRAGGAFPGNEPTSDAPCRSAGTTASAPLHRPVAVGTHAFARASSSPAQPGCFVDHPVKGGRFRTRSAYHRIAPPRPCGLGCGHPLGIRPHEPASCTRSPRPLPPSASTVRRVLPWLGRTARRPFDQRGSAIRDAHDR
jgi:hypothetical protein